MVITPNIQDWSYSHDPSSSDKDAVRFLIGDTNKNDKLLSDFEINYTVSQEGTVLQAAIHCLQNLIVVYSRHVDSSGNNRSRAYSQRVQSFRTSLDALLERQAMQGLNVFAGGISKAQKDTQCSDTDRVGPVFTKQMFDNPRAVGPNKGTLTGEGD
jgi:hypothetical protein